MIQAKTPEMNKSIAGWEGKQEWHEINWERERDRPDCIRLWDYAMFFSLYPKTIWETIEGLCLIAPE